MNEPFVTRFPLCLIAIIFLSANGFLYADQDLFLLSYFKDNGQEGVFLAYSEDGFKFSALNDDRPIFVPPEWEGQNLTRDPSILYNEGLFRMVWTSNWQGTSFGAVCSPDLKQWYKPVKVHPFTEWPRDDSPRNVWAPEVHWDPTQRNYLILWSSATKSLEGKGGHNSGGLENDKTMNVKVDLRHHRTFYSRSADFQTFSNARIFFNPGVSQIDAAMALDDGATRDPADDRWIVAVKHEQLRELGGKNIRLVSTSADLPLSSPPKFRSPVEPGRLWTEPVAGLHSNIQSHHMVEGPTLLHVGNTWWLYFDRFDMRTNRFGLAVSEDLRQWSDRTDELDIPPDARHGTIFRAPRSAVAFLN